VISRNCSQINFIADSSLGKGPRLRIERRSFARSGDDSSEIGFVGWFEILWGALSFV
jgi:hypothetical protein